MFFGMVGELKYKGGTKSGFSDRGYHKTAPNAQNNLKGGSKVHVLGQGGVCNSAPNPQSALEQAEMLESHEYKHLSDE